MNINWGPPQNIEHGPSKGELMLGFFTGGTFGFRTLASGLMDVVIDSIRVDDGSYEAWVMEGHALSHENRRVWIYWNTSHHHGQCKFEKPALTPV